MEWAHPWISWEGSWVLLAVAGPEWLREPTLESQLLSVPVPPELQKEQLHLTARFTVIAAHKVVAADRSLNLSETLPPP